LAGFDRPSLGLCSLCASNHISGAFSLWAYEKGFHPEKGVKRDSNINGVMSHYYWLNFEDVSISPIEQNMPFL
jgi:hypothetical protein